MKDEGRGTLMSRLIQTPSGNRRLVILPLVAVLIPLLTSSDLIAQEQTTREYIDIDDAGVHQPAINALKDGGFFDGTECEVGVFCPKEPMTRWVMAVWLMRAEYGSDNLGDTYPLFTDVNQDLWWAPHVLRLAELGITQGCAVFPLRYCPDEPVTRAQMASFLARYLNLDPSPPAGFADTTRSVHAAAIDSIAAAGITKGCATQPLRYCPDEPVTRAQMATLLYRALDTRS